LPGKRPDHHTLRQEEINRLLVERVQAGQQVVRLKGGDPFVFGRGGEEALALAAAGMPYEIVPGVSSALAVPAYAGVPVTHRNVATSFAVITGHEAADKADGQTDWDALARIPTLVVLMGVGQIASIAQALITAGRDAKTPAIAIGQGSTDQQRSVRATLADLPGAIAAACLPAPAVIVIGAVAAPSRSTGLVCSRRRICRAGGGSIHPCHAAGFGGRARMRETPLPSRYPITLTHLENVLAVVVGGGVVGERKVRGLLAAQAQVLLIAPTATPSLIDWAESGVIRWEKTGICAQ
jgi:uroporphyrin-III C-methyltransferase